MKGDFLVSYDPMNVNWREERNKHTYTHKQNGRSTALYLAVNFLIES